MQLKILVITNNPQDAALIRHQIPMWYGSDVSITQVESLQEGFIELETGIRTQQEYDRLLWSPEETETTDLSLLKKSFPGLNISIISTKNLSAGVRAYAQVNDLETINLQKELGGLKELLDREIRRKSGGTERVQLNRELASLEARYGQLKERIVELEKLIKDLAGQMTNLQIQISEKLNSLVLQVGQNNERSALFKATLDVLKSDNEEMDDRLNDLESIMDSGMKPGKGSGRDQALAVAIVTSGIGLLATVVTTLTPVVGPALNKWLDPDRQAPEHEKPIPRSNRKSGEIL